MIPPLFYLKAIFSKLKKAILIGLVFFVIIQLFFYFWSMSGPKLPPDPMVQARSEIYRTINDPKLNKTKEGAVYVGLYRTYMCNMIGEGCSDKPQDHNLYVRNSFMGQLSNLMILPYEHPAASGVFSTIATLQHAGFVPQSYAAEGIGFAALAPLRPVWLIFRNLIFLLMVLVIVAIGFMVMFRAKINPQTVISVESALPKIAITLLIITFSYAIAGFLIDVMYVVMGLLIGLFNTGSGLSFNPTEILNQAFYGESFGLFGVIFGNTTNGVPQLASAMYQVIPNDIRTILDSLVGWFGFKFGLIILGASGQLFLGKLLGMKKFESASFSIAKLFQSISGTKFLDLFSKESQKGGMPILSIIAALIVVVLGGTISSMLAPVLTSAIIYLILMLSLLFIFFKLFFMFISVYVQILILIIFSPVILSFEVIPGRSAFASWIKSLLLHLSTFPLFLMLVLVSKAIMSMPEGTTIWRPPFTYGFPGDSFKTIIAMALLYMAPEFIKMFKEMTGVKPMASALNLGAFFSGATTAVGGALGLATQFHSLKATLIGANVGEGLFGSVNASGQRTFTNPFNRVLGGIRNKNEQKQGSDS